MTQHTLEGRSDSEVLWFQRRSFLQAAAAWTSMGGFAVAQTQSRSNVVELVGDMPLLIPGVGAQAVHRPDRRYDGCGRRATT